MIKLEWPLFFIGLAVSFLGTLAGGGGLIGMPAMLLYGLPIHTIIAANKFSNTVSSFSSFYILLKQKEINRKDVSFILPVAIFGGMTGAFIAQWISEKHLTVFAIICLMLAFFLSFVRKPTEVSYPSKPPIYKLKPYLYSIATYDGMFGPGQGTLLLFTYLRHHFSYLQAVALSRCQTFMSCFGAFLLYFTSGYVEWSIALSLASGSIIGAQISVRLAPKMKLTFVHRLLQAVTFCLIIQLAYSFFTGGM